MRIKSAEIPDSAQRLETRGQAAADTCHHGCETRVGQLPHPAIAVGGKLIVNTKYFKCINHPFICHCPFYLGQKGSSETISASVRVSATSRNSCRA